MQIRRLDQTTINKIGAGEIIQRPVNVVKELVENSIDAHCSSISIIINGGGMTSISVTDDGDGISVSASLHERGTYECRRRTSRSSGSAT